MKLIKPVFIILLTSLAFFLLWSFFQPKEIPAAIANNVWSLAFIRQYFIPSHP